MEAALADARALSLTRGEDVDKLHKGISKAIAERDSIRQELSSVGRERDELKKQLKDLQDQSGVPLADQGEVIMSLLGEITNTEQS